MDHYLDFRLLPDPEFPAPILMNALFAKLHRALVGLDSRHVGVSFPEFRPERAFLGERLRLHGPHSELERLMTENWLKGMRDHLNEPEIAPIPDTVQHRRIRRVQPKSSAERLRRRYLKRHPGVSEAEAANLMPDDLEQRIDLPFIRLKSQSNGHHFCLFLEHLPLQEHSVEGEFNTYGLSAEATIPWF